MKQVTDVVHLGSVNYPLVVDTCSVPIGWRLPTLQELLDGAGEVLFARAGGPSLLYYEGTTHTVHSQHDRSQCDVFLADVFVTCCCFYLIKKSVPRSVSSTYS